MRRKKKKNEKKGLELGGVEKKTKEKSGGDTATN